MNIVFPGWHPSANSMMVNDGFEEVLERGLEGLPNVVLTTLPTALNERVAGTDITPHLVDPPRLRTTTDRRGQQALLTLEEGYRILSTGFWLWGGLEPTVPNVTELHRRILERNAAIRRVAGRLSLPLFDWHDAMASDGLDDFRRDFFDVGHPRPDAYQLIAQLWAGFLAGLTGAAEEQRAGESVA